MSVWVLLITFCTGSNCKVFLWDETFKGNNYTACNAIKKPDLEKIAKKYLKASTETHMKCVEASTKIEAWK